MEACHDERVGGCHFGRDKTAEKVGSRYYWKRLDADVEDWVSSSVHLIILLALVL